MVSVSVTSHRPSEAALQANELSRVMVKVVGEEMTAKTERTRQFIEEQLRVVGEKLKSSEERLRESRGKIDPQSASTALGGKLMELRNRKTELLQKYTVEHPLVRQTLSEIRSIEEQLQEYPNQQIDVGRITREVHLQEDLFTMLTKRQEEAQILESAHVAPVTIIEPAGEPGAPESPNKRFNMMMGAIAGALLGLIVVMVQHHFDTSMITPEEIEQYLQLPVLAAIPHIERREANPGAEGPVARKSDHMGEARSRLIPNFPPQSPHAEVHHLLRNNLMRDVHNGESRVFLFTSSVTAEGKSITAANFAIAAAQSGIPTLLAEMDLREPMVHRLFGLPAEPGLMNFFYTSPRWDTNVAKWEQIRKGEARLNESMNQEGLSNLNILSAGRIPSNPVSLLSSDRFFLLIQAMRQRYPLVVLDGAPALLFADSSIVGPHVDGIILVYRFGRTAREVLRRTHNQLVSSNAKILGVVVNDIMQGQVASYNRYYGAYYKGYRNKASPLPPAA
jgi:tyrosine-protein kinase Etk/Wzc